MRILIVEDDACVGELLVKMVGPGHEMDVAPSYDLACALAGAKDYDAAFVDLMLKEELKGGVRVARMLRGKGVGRIMIVTGATPDFLDEIKGDITGLVDSVVLKPFTVPEILRALGAAKPQARKTEEGSC